MQWLAAVCVRRPVFTWVLILSLIVVGGASALGLGVDRFPNVDFPMVVVSTALPGASPEQVETEITDPVEEALNSISGLDELRSYSSEGISFVAARFDLDKSTDVAAQEVRDRVNRILSKLPNGIEQPRVEKMDPDAAPIMLVAVSSTRSAREMTEFASKRLRRRLESLSGVGGVTVLGAREREIEVLVDPVKLESFGLTVRDVEQTLASENVELPGGDVLEGRTRIQLRVQGKLESAEAFARLPVTTKEGRLVRLSDVAVVRDGEEEATSAALLDGEQVVIVAIRKQSGANTVAVVDALKERIDEIKTDLPPSYRLTIVRDESEFVRNALHAVQEHLIVGGFLAALVVLLFLWNGRSTVIAALAIPSSIIATFALIRAMGLTLNTITLLALTLSVGIVIDDAIVVLENIVRFIEEKKLAARQAAVLATKEIGLAVLATTFSLVAVFLPIAFMGGIIGRFMASFGYTMSFAIVVSLFVSFTLTPMLSSRWLKGPVRPRNPREVMEEERDDLDSLEELDPPPGDRKEERARYSAWLRGEAQHEVISHGGGHEERGGIYGRIERAYLWLLAHSMRYRWIVGIVLIGTFLATFPLAKVVAKNFLPVDDESRFEITMRAKEGTSLAETQLLAERVAREVRSSVPGVARTVVTVGSSTEDANGNAPNEADIYIALVDPTERERDQLALIGVVRDEVLPKFKEYGLRTIVSPVAAFGGQGADSAAIQYVLSGPDLDKLGGYSQKLLEKVRKVPGVVDADSSLVTGRPSYEVHVDRERAADLMVSVASIASTLRSMVGGLEVTTFSEGGEQYEVRVRAPYDARRSVQEIELINVPARNGGTVRLGDIADIRPALGPATIQRLGRQRQVTVYCNVAPGGSEATIIQGFEAAKDSLDMEAGYSGSLTGRSRELGRAARSFAIAFGLSFAFMFLVLAAQFESWILPLAIIVSLPLTVPFAIFSLVATGQSLNIFSTLGILVLFGVVKKNSILQVDHIRGLRRAGMSRADAVMLGNRDRLRPILMTTIAFVAGMIPLVVSSGAGAGTNRAMGSVVMGGQSLALLLTLIATPVVYTSLDDLAHSRFVAFLGRMLRAPFLAVDRLFTRGEERPGSERPPEPRRSVPPSALGPSRPADAE